MKKGKLYITTDENDNPKVVFEPINNTVWLTQQEIASLFGVYTQTIGNNLRVIFKASILREDEVTYTHRYTVSSTKYQERQIVYYNLDVVIALAYRIKSRNAEILREWLVEIVCQKQENQFSIISWSDYDNISWN